VFWGVAALLLIVLWVRSYFYSDTLAKGWGSTTQQGLAISSENGALLFNYVDVRGSTVTLTRWKVTILPITNRDLLRIGSMDDGRAGFLFLRLSDGYLLSVPYWFLVELTLVVGPLPWLRWSNRFSLRTLLIATTLVAVVLGLIAWSME